MKALLGLALLCFALAPALRGDKQAPPAPAAPKGFSLPQPKTFRLDNGLAVTLVWAGLPAATATLAVDPMATPIGNSALICSAACTSW